MNPFQIDMVPLKSSAVAQLRVLLGLDRATVFTVLARGWSSLAGLVTILLIAHFLTSGAALVWGALSYLYAVHSRFAHRVLSRLHFGMLLLSMIINHIVISEAIYMRAHKQEKFLVNPITGATLMVISSYALGKHYGALGMAVGYLIISTLVGLILATFTFRKYRRIWHA